MLERLAIYTNTAPDHPIICATIDYDPNTPGDRRHEIERLFHSLLPTNWAHYNLQYKASQLTTPNPTLKQAVREWAIAENRTVATIYAADWTRRIRTLNHTTVHLHNTPCPRCKKATHTRQLTDGTTKVDDALAIIVRPEEQPSTRVMTCCGACGWTEVGYEAIKRLAHLQAAEIFVK